MREFLKEVVDEFDISPSGTHVAAVAYSTNPQVVFKFNTLQGARLNVDEVNKKLDRMPHQRGFTYIDRALRLADEQVFNGKDGMRPDVTKVYSFHCVCFILIFRLTSNHNNIMYHESRVVNYCRKESYHPG